MADLRFRAPIQYEPKTKNRFLLDFPTDIGVQTWAVKSVKAPNLNFETKEMGFFNTSTYVNTKYKWEAMQLTLRDFVAPNMAQALMEWMRLCAESVTGRMGYAIGYAKDLRLRECDPTGGAISEWLIEKAIPTNTVDFGDFDYDSGDIREITLNIQPQACILLY